MPATATVSSVPALATGGRLTEPQLPGNSPRLNASSTLATATMSEPTGEPVDFLSFARSEGRFAAHFAGDTEPTPEIQATQADRLANWRTLQELAGLRPAGVA